MLRSLPGPPGRLTGEGAAAGLRPLIFMITKEKYGRIGDFSFVIMLSAAAEVMPGPAAVDAGPST